MGASDDADHRSVRGRADAAPAASDGTTDGPSAGEPRPDGPAPGSEWIERAKERPVSERFRRFSEVASRVLGSVWAFTAAVAFTVGWAVAGPIFDYSDTWQLTMNTAASVVAFLMVFVIQNTQNRDTRAIHLKLDELIRAIDGTRKDLVRLEDLSDGDLKRLTEEFREIGLGRYRDETPDADRGPSPHTGARGPAGDDRPAA